MSVVTFTSSLCNLRCCSK